VFFLIVLLGSVALPLTNGFVGEFLLLTGLFQYSFWAAALAGLTVVLGAVYMLRSYQGIMLGAGGNKSETFTEAGKKEWWVLLPLAMVILFFGIYPAPLLEVIQAPVQELFELINAGIK
jgi:NADH-quinone oxidoreductase subunit M